MSNFKLCQCHPMHTCTNRKDTRIVHFSKSPHHLDFLLHSEHEGCERATICCAVKIQFRYVVLPHRLQRFVFLWVNLDWSSAQDPFGFSITLIREGRGTTCILSSHGKPNLKSELYICAKTLWFIVFGSLYLNWPETEQEYCAFIY